jgi:hypothetical protein
VTAVGVTLPARVTGAVVRAALPGARSVTYGDKTTVDSIDYAPEAAESDMASTSWRLIALPAETYMKL